MAERTCAATTKKGTPCTRTALAGSTTCLAHAPQKVRESKGFGGAQPGAGAPRKPKPSEIAQKLIEENVLALQRPYWLALGFDVVIGDDGPELVTLDVGGAKLYGTRQSSGDIVVSRHDDLAAQIAAAEKLQDRVYGRPKQQTELTGPEGGAIHIVTPPDAEAKSAKAAALLQRLGQVDGDR